MSTRQASSSRDERGQALVEFALGLPLALLAALFSFGLIDATTTQEAVEAGARRAATVLAGSNDDAQATGAAAGSGWLRGQPLTTAFSPDGSRTRCPGTIVTLTVSAPGHLGFVLLVPTNWTATVSVAIESAGARQADCP